MEKIKTWLETHISLYEYENSREEQWNSWTHLAGALLALLGLVLLIRSGLHYRVPGLLGSFIVFGISMVLLFASSGFYHRVGPSIAKRILRVLDHSNIYVLIAGTYTPLLVAMNTSLSIKLLVLVWGIALAGVFLKLIFWDRYGFLHVIFYLAMGWMVILIWQPMLETIPMALFKWILTGGIIYTVGVLFYAVKSIPYNHAIWHLFVLGGCASFFWGFLRFLPVS